MILSRGRKPERECLLEALAKEDTQIIALAYAHAQYLKMYGVDIEQALYTATENAEVMTRAYQRGYYDAMERGKCGERMNEIKCPYDLNQFLLGEPIFENPFPEEECEQRKFYGDCYHCFSTAIASRDHQLKNVINKIKEIVDEWQSDTWTDNLSYECMVKVAELVEPQESEDLGDYPDAIPNQFDNMTGSMNL